jgi:hypothetical protein
MGLWSFGFGLLLFAGALWLVTLINIPVMDNGTSGWDILGILSVHNIACMGLALLLAGAAYMIAVKSN